MRLLASDVGRFLQFITAGANSILVAVDASYKLHNPKHILIEYTHATRHKSDVMSRKQLFCHHRPKVLFEG